MDAARNSLRLDCPDGATWRPISFRTGFQAEVVNVHDYFNEPDQTPLDCGCYSAWSPPRDCHRRGGRSPRTWVLSRFVIPF